ncbi:MAG: DEAD/DEAH box helicase, partial [Bacteroidota bacterium]
MKSRADMLAKLGISALNPMQREAIKTIQTAAETILLSPTGTGKTLAFLLPLLAELRPKEAAVQALILVPSRELAIQ